MLEVPAPSAGVITAISQDEGAVVTSDQVIGALDTAAQAVDSTDKSQDWSGSLVTNTFTCDNSNSYLFCIDGTPTVNSKTLQKFDYSKLTSGKEYSVTLNGGVLGLFTKLIV